jgi:hypothetical protein
VNDIFSEFAIHVGTGTSLGSEAGAWHRGQADWREKEIRDFIGALAAVARVALEGPLDDETQTLAIELLKLHPGLTDVSANKESP